MCYMQVLYLVEPIDEVAIQNLQTYKEKKFIDISKEDLELGQFFLVKYLFFSCITGIRISDFICELLMEISWYR